MIAKKILVLITATLLASALAAGPLDQLRKEQAPLFQALKADGVVFAWDQAVVLNMNVKDKPMTSINLTGTLDERKGVMVTLTAMGKKGAAKPLIVGVMLDADKLTETGAKITMVGWSFLENKVTAMTMTTGTMEAAPAAMSLDEAKAMFKAYLPHTFAYLQKQNSEE